MNNDTIKAYKGVLENFANIISQIDNLREPKVYNNEDAMKILKVGEKMLRKYRNEGYLSYSKVDDKYWYTEKDIEEFLQNSHCDAFAFA